MVEGNGQGGTGRERLLDDLALVIRDAEQLLRGAGLPAGEQYDAALARLESVLMTAADGVSSAAAATGRYVREKPWQSAGIGALAGLVLGMWIGRR